MEMGERGEEKEGKGKREKKLEENERWKTKNTTNFKYTLTDRITYKYENRIDLQPKKLLRMVILIYWEIVVLFLMFCYLLKCQNFYSSLLNFICK